MPLRQHPQKVSNTPKWDIRASQQRRAFGQLYETFSPEHRVFENRNFLAGLGERVSKCPIKYEKTLECFLHNTVEDPRSTFEIGNGIIFENQPDAISDNAEEVIARQATSSPPRTRNQICVYWSNNELSRRTMIYTIPASANPKKRFYFEFSLLIPSEAIVFFKID
ncbi:hypothetical protein F4824DRAFT_492514 [Ustulina deusta]|nr:hypothetical protein F4824DRAFT_492514 [Ustulina deusta]